MRYSAAFYKSILDSVTEHIAIIDHHGIIQYVNAAWVSFGISNQSALSKPQQWRGINYLDVCDVSAGNGDASVQIAAAGTRNIIERKAGIFYHEYPCDSATERRWFMMRVTPLQWDGQASFVISHQNITERKLAEEKVQALSLTDELTGLPNRRHFDQFLSYEWRRAARTHEPLSLILVDVDHFKSYNDQYGHLGGDECLKSVGAVLKNTAKRPGDLCARYGGDEFALILSNTDSASAAPIAHELLGAVRRMDIPRCSASAGFIVTASLGVATMRPRHGESEQGLFQAADQALYRAKNKGRNKVFVSKSDAPADQNER